MICRTCGKRIYRKMDGEAKCCAECYYLITWRTPQHMRKIDKCDICNSRANYKRRGKPICERCLLLQKGDKKLI